MSTNQWGVAFEGGQDFSRWGLDECGTKVGDLILDTLREQTMADIEWEAGAVVKVGLFEYEAILSTSLQCLVEQWVAVRRARDGRIEEEERGNGEAMAAQFERLAALLRKACR